MDRINSRSQAVRAMLASTCPEVVTTAEQFATRVLYVPASALGNSPIVDQTTGGPAIRPRDIRPSWVIAPFLISLREGVPGLVSRLKSRGAASTDGRNGPSMGILESPHRAAP
jgi:hypothetical protein